MPAAARVVARSDRPHGSASDRASPGVGAHAHRQLSTARAQSLLLCDPNTLLFHFFMLSRLHFAMASGSGT